MGIVKTPFSDQVGKDSVPKTASKGAGYETPPMSGVPGRDGSGVAKEVYYDKGVTSKDPSTKGFVKSPFKDAVS